MRCRSGRVPAFTLIELLVVIAILGLVMALTAAGVQRVRFAAIRLQCAGNLRQIGLALANYHGIHGKFPPGMSLNNSGPESFQYMSWLTRLLPYVEQESLWRQSVEAYQVEPRVFMHSPPHPFTTVIPLYGCPADSRSQSVGVARDLGPVAFTSYLGISGRRTIRRAGVLYLNSTTRFADIIDGTSNTLLVGERPPSEDLWYGWWYAGAGCDRTGRGDMVLGVRDSGAGCFLHLTQCSAVPLGFRPGKIDDNCDALHFWSLHPGGAHFCFADGSVRFLRYSADAILPALATRAGGEPSALPD